jgi:CRP-like cAMP-binding protein
LSEAGAPERFRRGDVIYSTTQFRRAVGVVTSGTVRVFRHGAVLNRLECGGVFGVAALYGEEEEYVTEVRAASACEVQFFSQELLDRWMREDFRLAENYIRFLSDRIRFLNRRIAAFTGGAADERLLAFLRGRADKDGVVTLSMSMTELSRALDIGRSSLYRSLELLEQDGTIRRQGKQIYLHEKRSDSL